MTRHLLGAPVVNNVTRGTLAEAIVALSPGTDWHWQGDWEPFDFRHSDGTELEVKQSALVQPWTSPPGQSPRPTYDIAVRSRHWDRAQSAWRANTTGRRAPIYIFALHSEADRSRADHRLIGQWRFRVVPGADLPQQKTIMASVLAQRWPLLRAEDLPEAVAALKARLPAPRV